MCTGLARLQYHPLIQDRQVLGQCAAQGPQFISFVRHVSGGTSARPPDRNCRSDIPHVATKEEASTLVSGRQRYQDHMRELLRVLAGPWLPTQWPAHARVASLIVRVCAAKTQKTRRRRFRVAQARHCPSVCPLRTRKPERQD